MDKYLLNTLKQSEIDALNSLYAEMMLDKALRDFQIEQIQKGIDHSLQCGDKEEFFRLTEQLKKLH